MRSYPDSSIDSSIEELSLPLNPMKKTHIAAFAVASIVSGPCIFAADHLDAPNLGSAGNGDVDINDLYAFQSPTNADNTVLILTVNPGAGGGISGNSLNENAFYSLNIDNDGDAFADITYQATFSGGAGLTNSQQMFSINRIDRSPDGVSSLLAAGTTGGTGGGVAVPTTVGGQAQVGTFDDPFFFDLEGFQATLAGTGTFEQNRDFFAGLDVTAIIIEVPSADLIASSSNIGVWATTSTASDGSGQIDRIGRPAINTVLINGDDRKIEFNEASPDGDFSVFGDEVDANIDALGGDGAGLTPILLADILTIDVSSDSGFDLEDPILNGRGLADDVIDVELGLLTGGGITSDLVDANDAAFGTSFPFLAAANVPEPSSALLLAGASRCWDEPSCSPRLI